MSKIWYLSIHAMFYGLWYFSSSATVNLSKFQLLWSLTSLEWVSTYISFTYFFLALLASFKSSIIKPKLRSSLYLLMMSLNSLSLLVLLLLGFEKREEEYEEFVLDFRTVYTNVMTKGGLFVMGLVELGNLKGFECPSWKILIFFDVYLAGWYAFVQYMCKKASGSYSYQFLNNLTIEQLVIVGAAAFGFIIFAKYVILSINPPKEAEKPANPSAKKNKKDN